MKRYRAILVLYFVFFIFLPAFVFGEADRVIAIVNHEAITKAELDAHSNFLRMQMGQDAWQQLRMSDETALEALIEDLLILQEARRKGIDVDERSVSSRFERIRKTFKTDDEFSAMLSEQGLSVDTLMKRIKEQMVVEEFISRQIRSRVFIGPKEVTDFYEAHQEEFILPERVELDTISVNDKSLAEDIYAKLKLGLDFTAVKENYSEKEGIAGIIKKGELRREIDEVIFSLAEGAFTAPIEIKNKGYFIFFVRKKYPPDERKGLLDVQDRIRDLLSEREFQKRLGMLLEELKKNSYIVIK